MVSCSNKKNKSSKILAANQDTSIALCFMPGIDNLIRLCDTLFDQSNYKGHIIRCFDKNGQLLKRDSTNLYTIKCPSLS